MVTDFLLAIIAFTLLFVVFGERAVVNMLKVLGACTLVVGFVYLMFIVLSIGV